jgi:hypothetical protein
MATIKKNAQSDLLLVTMGAHATAPFGSRIPRSTEVGNPS